MVTMTAEKRPGQYKPVATGLDTPGSLATGIDPLAAPIADINEPKNASVRFSADEWGQAKQVLDAYRKPFSVLVRQFFELTSNGYRLVSPEDFELLQQAKAEQAKAQKKKS